MKLAKSVSLLVIGLAALSIGITGCKRGVQKPVSIGGTGPVGRVGGETPGAPIEPGPAIAQPPIITPDLTRGQGIVAPKGDFSNYIENRAEFRDQTVYFDFDKSNIKPGEVSKLQEVARRMKSSFRGKALRIEGHCDERGTEEYNRSLGDRRAQSIREFLAREGLDPEMLPTITFGEDRPADLGHNEAAWAKNRRGELILLSPP